MTARMSRNSLPTMPAAWSKNLICVPVVHVEGFSVHGALYSTSLSSCPATSRTETEPIPCTGIRLGLSLSFSNQDIASSIKNCGRGGKPPNSGLRGGQRDISFPSCVEGREINGSIHVCMGVWELTLGDRSPENGEPKPCTGGCTSPSPTLKLPLPTGS